MSLFLSVFSANMISTKYNNFLKLLYIPNIYVSPSWCWQYVYVKQDGVSITVLYSDRWNIFDTSALYLYASNIGYYCSNSWLQ